MFIKFNSKNVAKFINKAIRDLREEKAKINASINFTEKKLGELKADKEVNKKLLEKLEGLK